MPETELLCDWSGMLGTHTDTLYLWTMFEVDGHRHYSVLCSECTDYARDFDKNHNPCPVPFTIRSI